MQSIINLIICFFFFFILLGIIGDVKMKTVFIEVPYRGKTILINTDHIISIVPGEQDSFWIGLTDGKEPVEITKEQKDKLFELIKLVKL
ncbi:MAG: hypothetical protein PUK02_08020 [Parabacteroides sp.]|nr:hypothetical protein [Parabacteroides sp.]